MPSIMPVPALFGGFRADDGDHTRRTARIHHLNSLMRAAVNALLQRHEQVGASPYWCQKLKIYQGPRIDLGLTI